MARGSIRKRAGRYYVRTRVRVIDPDTGRPVWRDVERAAGRKKRDAVELLDELRGSIKTGTFKPGSKITVLELGQWWLREHVQPNLKPSTAADYKGTFYKHVAPVLGAYPVSKIDEETISLLLSGKLDEGAGRPTVQKLQRQLHALFEFAIDKKIMAVNPAARVKPLGSRQRRRKARGTALSPAEAERFLRACSPRWRLFFRVALSTGLRRGEMIGLRWGDVSLSESMLTVRRSISPYDDISDEESLTTKTEAGERIVPLFPDALQALEELYGLVGDPGDEDPVFETVEAKPGIEGARRPSVPGGVLSPRLVTRAFRRYAENAGLSANLTLHDLRHTTVTRLIEQGAQIDDIAAIAGHSKTSTTVDIYSHLLRGRVREMAGRFDPTRFPHVSHSLARALSHDVLEIAEADAETPANPDLDVS